MKVDFVDLYKIFDEDTMRYLNGMLQEVEAAVQEGLNLPTTPLTDRLQALRDASMLAGQAVAVARATIESLLKDDTPASLELWFNLSTSVTVDEEEIAVGPDVYVVDAVVKRFESAVDPLLLGIVKGNTLE